MKDPLAPWLPTADAPFDLRRAGHLLRRVRFGASLEQRTRLVEDGFSAAIGSIHHSATAEAAATVAELNTVLALTDIDRVRAWRFMELSEGAEGRLNLDNALRLRMSYFWHHHFATSNVKIQDPAAMARQLALFDRLGLGSFDALLLAVAQDAAMLRWLDNDRNRVGEPNENFARELFELFTLGRGNDYDEADVVDAARAFTGWHVRRGKFFFDKSQHDGKRKTVLGVSGNLRGEDVIAQVAAHPSCARFIAGSLLAFFVHPNPTESEIDAAAAEFTAQERHIGRTVASLLQSQLFFSERAYRSRIKSPTEFVVGLVRAMGSRASSPELARAAAKMGETLLEPPSVEGWRGGRAWLNPATWLARSNYAAACFEGRMAGLTTDAKQLLGNSDSPWTTAIEHLLDGHVADPTIRPQRTLDIAKFSQQRSAAGTMQLVASLPDFQLL